MSYLLDTNACIALIKGKPESVGLHLRRARSLDEGVFISSITAHELWYGVAKRAHRQNNTKGSLCSFPDLSKSQFQPEAVAA